MPIDFNQDFPPDLWIPCYPVDLMKFELLADGLHIATLPQRWAYAARYPLLKAPRDGYYSAKLVYRVSSGGLAFGALEHENGKWIAQSEPPSSEGNRLVKRFTMKLKAGDPFVLLITNDHPTSDIASTFVVEKVAVYDGKETPEVAPERKSEPIRHHKVFSRFSCWPVSVPAGSSAYFVGSIFREWMLSGRESTLPARVVSTSHPPFDEGYFEWLALLSSVVAARGKYTMMELGAGFGRWLAKGGCAARRLKLPFKLIGVEAEPTHFKWMEMCLRDNGIDPAEHHLVEAAVAAKEGEVWFHTGQAMEWYGQRMAFEHEASSNDSDASGSEFMRKVRAVTLNSLLQPFDSVDFIDMDIQGAEAEVLAASMEQLDARVKMVFVGTHRHPVNHSHEIEDAVTEIFKGMKWIDVYRFPCMGESETPYGPVKFDDGVQVWVNPKATETLDVIREKGL